MPLRLGLGRGLMGAQPLHLRNVASAGVGLTDLRAED